MGRNFALIGAAGFVAPRHMQAIKAVGGNLIAAFDVNDSVGVLDSYAPDCRFFIREEAFANFLKARAKTDPIDYVAICSPNHKHVPHIRLALELGAHAICEKPVCLTLKDVDELSRLELACDRRVYTILQLRLHDAVKVLRTRIQESPRKTYSVDLTYITSRGSWYLESWKGDALKAGGLSTNIGVHFFDMLTWIFGPAREAQVTEKSRLHELGTLELANASVNWFLSIDRRHLPETAVKAGKSTFRSIRIDGEEFEFSDGFTDLHSRVYHEILDGRGCGLAESAESIRLVENLRKMPSNTLTEVVHL